MPQFLKSIGTFWTRNTMTASLQPSGLSSLLAALRCSLATERASHVAGRSTDRPAELPGAVRHRRAVSGLSFRGALAGRLPLHRLSGLFGAGHEAFVRAGIGDWRMVAARAPLTGPTPRAGAVMVPFAGLLAALEGIPDPRRRQGRRYPLAPLLLFSVLAVLAGATSYRGILTFIGVHRERLNAVFGARLRRAPAVNTLRDLLHALDPAELEAAFRRHAEQLGGATTAPGRRVIALDGKTLRGSFDHLDDQAAAQVLSAFASEGALILAHQEIAQGDEVAAAQALIERLGLSGVLFTADALHCQKNVRLRDRDRQRPAGAAQAQPARPA